jgi:hypothetical protein
MVVAAAPVVEPMATIVAAAPVARFKAPACVPVRTFNVCVPAEPLPERMLTVELAAEAPAAILIT